MNNRNKLKAILKVTHFVKGLASGLFLDIDTVQQIYLYRLSSRGYGVSI
jgi:hypothetical protein